MTLRATTRMPVMLSAILGAAGAGSLHAQPPPANDRLIVPGERIGPITAESTIDDLRRFFGPANVANQEIDIGEGMTEPGTVVFGDEPEQALYILWQESGTPRTVFICRHTPCAWHTADGISHGTSSRELERLNGQPFALTGFGWDYGGTIVSWEGGTLERLDRPWRVILRLSPEFGESGYAPALTPAEDASVAGDRDLPSSHPVMRKLNPRVYALEIWFPVN